MNPYIRSDLKKFRPYHAPIKPYDIKVDANELAFGHQHLFQEHMAQWLSNKDHITRYPDTDCVLLREKIAEVYGITKEQIMCGVGSDQVIELIIKAFIEPGETVIVPTPSFSMYGLSTIINHGRVVEVPLDENFEYNTELFISVIRQEKPKLIFICTPNNPTGCKLSREEILQILDEANCPVVIDEAYADFIGESMISDLANYPDMILLRTFSKSFGLAGLRTGFAIANVDMIESLNLVKPPYNLSSYSQEASIFVLGQKAYYDELIQQCIRSREWLRKELETIPYIETIFDSYANFILIRVNHSSLPQLLQQQKILVRDYPPTGPLARCIRITIGTEEENIRLIQSLKEAIHESSTTSSKN
jgi:histidinol-phosphate aminotransferase